MWPRMAFSARRSLSTTFDLPPSNGLLWNLQEYVRRLGFNRQGALPELAFGVQPTLIVGDAREITSPFLAPFAMFGGRITSSLFETSVFAIRSLAAGGSFVRTLRFSTDRDEEETWFFTLSDTVTPLLREELCPGVQMGPEDCTAEARVGAVVFPSRPTNIPTIRERRGVSLENVMYIPPGQELTMFFDDLGGGIQGVFFTVIADAPAIPSART